MCCRAGGAAWGVRVPPEEKRGAKLGLHLARVTHLAPVTVDRGHAVELLVVQLSQKLLWCFVTV